MANITTTKNKVTFSMQMSSPAWQKMIVGTLQDKQRAARFTASIVSAVSVNPALQECEGSTILAGALLGESLNLSPSPQLGQYYLVPFKNTKRGTTEAAFVLGYKGYIQLALRSGYYKKLNVIAIKEGELINYDALNKDFDGMAYKTMLRQLISKWGIMSTELEQAYTNDMAILRDGQPPEYFDNQPDEPIMPETAPTVPAEEATEIDLTQI